MKIFVSGLINIETCLNIHSFPVEYSPIEFRYNEIKSNISGVGYNVYKALKKLNNEVVLSTFIGKDLIGEVIKKELKEENVNLDYVLEELDVTCNSLILFNDSGKRKIYCDLSTIQDKIYSYEKVEKVIKECSGLIICNINYNDEIIKKAKMTKIPIFCDVHVLSDINDSYNKRFMENADVLFLSDEGIKEENYIKFINDICDKYNNDLIVLGCGEKGAILLDNKSERKIYKIKSVYTRDVVNSCGAGDALFSCFVNYYLKTLDPLESLKKAMVFASYKIGESGGANGFLNESELEDLTKNIKFDFEIIGG